MQRCQYLLLKLCQPPPPLPMIPQLHGCHTPVLHPQFTHLSRPNRPPISPQPPSHLKKAPSEANRSRNVSQISRFILPKRQFISPKRPFISPKRQFISTQRQFISIGAIWREINRPFSATTPTHDRQTRHKSNGKPIRVKHLGLQPPIVTPQRKESVTPERGWCV